MFNYLYSRLTINNLGVIILIIFTISPCCGRESPVIECVDNKVDLLSNSWEVEPNGEYIYVDIGEDLPVSGLEDAVGVFYFDGFSSSSVSQRFYKVSPYTKDGKATFVYVRYYAHVLGDNGQEMSVYPTDDVTMTTELGKTDGFVWGEKVIRLAEDLSGVEVS